MAKLGRVAVLVWAALVQVTVASSRGQHWDNLANATATNEASSQVVRVGELRGSHDARRTGDAAGKPELPRQSAGLTSVEAKPHKVEVPIASISALHTLDPETAEQEAHKEAQADKAQDGKGGKKVVINPDTGEPVSERNAALSGDKYYFYSGISAMLILAGLFLWCILLPSIIIHEWSGFQELKRMDVGDRTFGQFLVYRFNNWMNSEGLAANTKILLGGTLSLVTAGALCYWLVTGRSIKEGLWLVFLWASASSVDAASPRASGTVGVAVTVGGVILLAILLGTITEFFANTVQASKEGRDAIVEGGHIVVLGHSENTKALLEELALADPDEPLTVVLMDHKPKQEIEKDIMGRNTQLGNLKLVVRSGHGSAWQDLKKVAADMASRIVIPEDPSATREESDAANFGMLLTLRGQKWPKNGYVTVQCCATRNDSIMRDLGPDPTLVINGERLGRLMVQSSRDQGLCQVFSQIIGFEGDEFYSKTAKELGVVGWSFENLAFCFPSAIPIGVQDAEGQCYVNPESSRVIKDCDEIIMLAEDEDSVVAAGKELLDFQAWKKSRGAAEFTEADSNDHEKATVLVCNFADRSIGCALLFALDESLVPGSEVDIFTGLEEEECKHILANAQKRQGHNLDNLKITIHNAPSRSMASMHYMERLRVKMYDHVFVLADREAESYEKADTKTVAMIIQLRHLMEGAAAGRTLTGGRHFNPVVETCTNIAEEQLAMCGITNVVNTSLILSRALALVTMKRVSHGVLNDLLSVDGNNLDIMDLTDYLGQGEKLPAELNFAEATAYVQRAAQQVLIGWTRMQEETGQMEYIMNPKDKVETRPWSVNDRLVVIKDV